LIAVFEKMPQMKLLNIIAGNFWISNRFQSNRLLLL